MRTKKPRVVWVVVHRNGWYLAAVLNHKVDAAMRAKVWNKHDGAKNYTVKKFIEAKRGK